MFPDFLYKCTKIFLIVKKNWARYYYKSTQVFKYSVRYSCQILKKLEFYLEIFEKKNAHISNIMKIYFVVAKLFHANWWTDRGGKRNSRFSQFCKCAYNFLVRALMDLNISFQLKANKCHKCI